MRISDWSSDVCSSDLKGWVEGALGLSGFFSRRREKGFISVEVELLGELVVAEFLQGLPAGLGAVGGFGLLFDAGVDGAALFGDLGEVADAGAGDEDGGAGFLEGGVDAGRPVDARSEEHTSELQSLMRTSSAVFCLKKKNNYNIYKYTT